ncbi:Nocturnin [Dactylellina cionopaga]|nr:Nocturnin [Dactylellina cionopaga]
MQVHSRHESPSPLHLRIISHNIRYATANPFRGEEPWPSRLPLLISQLYHITSASASVPTIICLQEVLHNQLTDILTNLNSSLPSALHWTSIGAHRDDGDQAGEASPVIYQPSIFTLISSTTTWLSPTPTVPSKGWDAASIRILTHGIFQHIPSGEKLVFMSTHLDDQGSVSRLHAAEMIITIVSEYTTAQRLPVVLAGDFNSEITQEAYKRLAKDDSGVSDVRDFVSGEKVYGEENTYTGFGYEGESEKRIDFIFVNDSVQRAEGSGSSQHTTGAENAGKKLWKVNGYAVMPNKFKDIGVFISDHRAVVADLELQGV